MNCYAIPVWFDWVCIFYKLGVLIVNGLIIGSPILLGGYKWEWIIDYGPPFTESSV